VNWPLPDRASVARLLTQALPSLSPTSAAAIDLQLVRSGGNNRLFLARLPREQTAQSARTTHWALKQYFRDAGDPRDRLATEFAFAAHAWQHGVRQIAHPLAQDASAGLGLYAWVNGIAIGPDQVTGADVRAAAQLLLALNSDGSRRAAAALPDASEARFSIEAHLALVTQRVARLANARPEPSVQLIAHAVIERVASAWQQVREAVETKALALDLSLEESIPSSSRCLSPSDFGFHNALRRANGALCFLDFEYAGWDDPAKALGDFFAHPGVPVSRDLWSGFWDVAKDIWAERERETVRRRAELLEPVFRLKWACIVLNELLPDAAKRRAFAGSQHVTELPERADRQLTQIEKAHLLLDTL
jgi:hypothetical protein